MTKYENPEHSEYFSHWEYTGNAIQRRLKIGPRKPMFNTMSEKEAMALSQAGETIDLPIPVAVTGARKEHTGQKAITIQEFNRIIESGSVGMFGKVPSNLLKKSPWAQRCVSIRAMSLAAIPWDLWQGDSPVGDNNPWKSLLMNVNPEMNWQDLAAATESDMNVYGKGLWLRIGDDQFLQRLNPSIIKIDANEKGISSFVNTKTGKKYPRSKVIYFHTYHPHDDFNGLSPLEAVRDPIEVEIEANAHLKEFFENKAMPDFIMSLETSNINEIKRVADQWNREFGGRGNRHKTGWVGAGGRPHEIGYAPKDLALAEVREEARRQICAGFGVPPALVAAWEAANYATIREQRQSLYTEVLFPEARYMQGVINAELLSGSGLEFRWDFSRVDAMQETEDAKAKRAVWLVDARIIKPEVAAVQLGYDEDDVPEPMPVPDFTPRDSSDNNNNVGRQTTPPPISDERKDKSEEDLYKWRRKALNNIKADQPPHCEFISKHIPDALNQQIEAALRDAKTREDVMTIFEAAVETPLKVEDDMNKSDFVQLLTEAIKASRQELTIKADNLEVINSIPKIDVPAPRVSVSVPEQKAPQVTVNVPETKQEAPIINVEPTPIVVENMVELPTRIRSRKKVNRDRNDRIDSVDEVTELG